MNEAVKIIRSILLALLLIDFTGYATWKLSGQHPQDGFYIGAITAEFLGSVQ